MAGFGLGFGSHTTSRQYATLGQNVPVAILRPSAIWNGTPGSGFAGAVPTDPLRLTAKPACRLLVPPNQWFTDELVVGVWAAANHNGSLLDNLGLERVTAHCEGASVAIEAPSFYLLEDANGNLVRYYGWWVVLRHHGTDGHANVYFEAVPKDPSMQRRVIGPYQFSPQAVLHDYRITIAPSLPVQAGSRYQTFQAAMTFLNASNAQNPLVIFSEAMALDMSLSAVGHSGSGYCTISATAPITFSKPSFSTSAAARLFRTGYDGLWFRGPNITIDFKDAAYIYHENAANRDHVFEGIAFIKSDGRDATFMLGTDDTIYISRDRAWFMECSVEGVSLPFVNARLVRGCRAWGGVNDIASNVHCFVGNTCHDWNSGTWRTPIPALTVQYFGSGTGTLELSGGSNVHARVLTAKVAGNTVGAFTISATEAGFIANTNYTVRNVMDWLNSLPGWSATLLDDSRRAAALGLSGSGSLGAAFGATDAKTAPLTLVTVFDLHTDMWRLSPDTTDNIICAGNLFFDCVGQGFFVVGSGGLTDVIIANNTMNQDETDPDAHYSYTQLGDDHSHVVFAHNSMTQPIQLRTDATYNPDGYCLLANSVAPRIVWAGTPDLDLAIKDNHLFGGAAAPSGATDTSIGGTKASLFVAADSGDFTPQGELLGNPKPPILRIDRAGVARGVPDVPGALAGGAQVAPAITSANPSGTYPEGEPLGGTLTANKPVTWSVEGPDAATVSLDLASGGWALETTDFETRASYAFAFVATDWAGDTAEQNVAITVADVDEIAPILQGPVGTANGTTGATLVVSTGEGNGTLHWYLSTSANPPLATALLAGSGAVASGQQPVTTRGAQSVSVSGLAAGTVYWAHFLHRDHAGNDSAIGSAGSFATDAAPGDTVSVVHSETVLTTSSNLTVYPASPFAFAGGSGKVLIAVVACIQQSAQSAADLTATVDGVPMTRVAGAAHSAGTSQPVCGVFVAAGLAPGSKVITVDLNGGGRSCTVLAMEVDGLDPDNLLANAMAREGSTLTYSHSYTPTAAGNLLIGALATKQGTRGPFTPDAGVSKVQDVSTGSTVSSDHSCFVGHVLAPGTAALDVGATTAKSADALFLVAEFKRA
jgi:hypothetical protein